MNILSFDLELNQALTGAKIIEVGACIGNLDTNNIIAEYTALVNPHEVITDRIIELTGITQDMVDSGGTILEAYEGMIKMALKYDCLKMPLTWGYGDLPAIKKEIPKEATKFFGRREIDSKTLYQCYQLKKGEKVQAGLAKAMKTFGLNFSGKQHRATDDAKNTFTIFCALMDKINIATQQVSVIP